MELWRYYRILRRRRWLILICMAVCIGGVAFFSYSAPEEWVGETTVKERQPSGTDVSVFQDRSGIDPNIQVHLNDLMTIASSSTVLERSAETLEQMGVTVDPVKLVNSLKVTPMADTSILQIRVYSTDRNEAKAGADVISNEFQRRYRELNSGATEQSKEFIERQLKAAKIKLEKARQAVKEFKEQQDVVELALQTQTLVQRMAQLEADELDARASALQLAKRREVLDSQVKSRPEMRLASETVANNPIYQSLLTEKLKAESQLGAMMATRGRKHPDVIELQKQVAEISEKLKDQLPEIMNTRSTALDQVRIAQVQEQLLTSANSAGVNARVAALQQALNEKRAKLALIPKEEMRMAQLTLERDAAQATYTLLRQKLDEAIIKAHEANSSSEIQTITPAYAYPVDKKIPLKLALALLLSPLLGTGLAFMLHYLDNTVRTPAEAEDLLGLPVVTVIPLSRSYALARRPENEPLLASYEMLTALLWRSESRAILVASAEPETGRSTTAANLAITLARDGARVILVDGDMRKPSLHNMFGSGGKPGLANVLAGTVKIEDAVMPTKIEGLLLMPAGPAPDNPVRLLRSEKLSEFITEITALADFIVFDSPAGATFADASLLASAIKNVVLVHSAGRVPRGAESEFKARLDMSGAEVVGVVLNRVRPEDSHGYFHYRRFYKDSTAKDMQKIAAMSGVKAIPSDGYDDDKT